MPAPTAQTIEQYLYDLAFGDLWQRIEREFLAWEYTHEEAFIFAEDHLRGAYFDWAQDHDALGALSHLDNVRAICNQRLTPAYLLKYNTVVSYFEANASRAGTPVHQDAHMRNLLLRVTTCLH